MEDAMSDDLAARVLAAIDETEQLARAATEGPWTAYRNRGVFAGVLDRDWVAGTDPVDAIHIAHNDPNAVQRRCAADRKLIEDALAWTHDYNDDDPWFSCAQAVVHWDPTAQTPGAGCANEERAGGPCDCVTGAHRERILTALAAAYGITTEETAHG
jgi:hypothetical protein